MKKIIFLITLLGYSIIGYAQSFINGDLDGTIEPSSLPTNWEPVVHTDINCNATSVLTATANLTGLNGPFVDLGVVGTPFSGATFVSGNDHSNGSNYWHEGIQQTVSGFVPNNDYLIRFYQTVVKQSNLLDTSGSWSVFLGNNLIGITSQSISTLNYNNTDLVWEMREVRFTATSNTHTIKFLPTDDDENSEASSTDINGGLRMGIDQIELIRSVTTSTNEIELNSFSVFPNPMKENLNIDLKKVYQNIKIVLVDINGKVVLTRTYSNLKDVNMPFDGPKGMYFLKLIMDSDVSRVFKIIKE